MQIVELKFCGLPREFTVCVFPYFRHRVADLFTKSLSTGVILFVDVALSELLSEGTPLTADGFDLLAETEWLGLWGWLYGCLGNLGRLFGHAYCVKI